MRQKTKLEKSQPGKKGYKIVKVSHLLVACGMNFYELFIKKNMYVFTKLFRMLVYNKRNKK